MSEHLPTIVAANWQVAGFFDSIETSLRRDNAARELTLFAYAVTESGWRALRRGVRKWLRAQRGRVVRAYVGTDHALTEPDALKLMRDDGVDVQLLVDYHGVFHPKVVWLASPRVHRVWIGSNNLTRDGLFNNVEFAAGLECTSVPAEFARWADEVRAGSEPLTDKALRRYTKERETFSKRRANLGTFVWSGRAAKRSRHRTSAGHRAPRSPAPVVGGELILEVMPRETGQGGKQIQLPKQRPVFSFFQLPIVRGSSRVVSLTPSWINDPRDLTMTVFPNDTVRLVIRELDYRDRPCVLVFRHRTSGRYEFDLVPRAILPAEYQDLLQRCRPPTRVGSRRWTIV